ncbi:Putative transcriptional regulator (fragment) [Syntrophobacter sp. SbD2]
MTKVFIGGSRGVSRLSEPIRMRLDRIIEKGLPVIIGDANGADKAVQQYLNSKNYLNVVVFCSGHACRNNLGSWKQRKVSSSARNKTFDFYAAKDRAMADEATVGFMVWNGKSKGTLLNVLRLLKRQKKAVLYNVTEKRFYELKALAHWEEFISHCDGELRNKVEQQAAIEDQERGSLSPESSKPRRVARRVNDGVLNIPAS